MNYSFLNLGAISFLSYLSASDPSINFNNFSVSQAQCFHFVKSLFTNAIPETESLPV